MTITTKQATLELETGSTLAESTYEYEPSQAPYTTSDVISNNYLTKLRQTDIIHHTHGISSPFAFQHSNLPVRLPLIYCDHTASNRALHSIERFIYQTVLPLYANTHTTTNFTGSQCTAWLAESRQIVAEACNARTTGKASTDVVLFTGNGATGAIELALNLAVGAWQAKYARYGGERKRRIVVYIGPIEHHSNMLPFRELKNRFVQDESVEVELCNVPPVSAMNGAVDLHAFEAMLVQQDKVDTALGTAATTATDDDSSCLKIGCFSAASNVTGLISDIPTITALLKKHGVLSFIDYATAAPYMPIDVNLTNTNAGAPIDAAFISTHKLLGGINTPGILIVKKSLIDRTIPPPNRVGGGTVFYTTESDTLYTTNWIERNEGGTPNVIGCIRSGLAFLTRKKLLATNYWDEYRELETVLEIETNLSNGYEETQLGLTKYEDMARNLCLIYLKSHASNIVVLGGDVREREHLPIFSFLIRCGDRFLHYNLVCAILNDIFGIQSRGGCQCAGPYSQRLLGLCSASEDNRFHPNEANTRLLDTLISEKAELLRPGFTRLSLNFTLSAKEIRYVLSGIVWVCKHGYELCGHGLYTMNAKSGEWRHHTRQSKPLGNERTWLTQINENNITVAASESVDIEKSIKCGDEVLTSLCTLKQSTSAELYDDLRWFMTPSDCAKLILSNTADSCPVSNTINGAIQPIPSLSAQVNSLSAAKPESSKHSTYPFRDGEFSGIAPLEEILEGHASGELSDECIIFVDGKWEDIVTLSLFSQVQTKESVLLSTPTILINSVLETEPKHTENLPISIGHDNLIDDSENIDQPKWYKPITPPKKLMRNIQKAVLEHDMILEGDVLLLGLSGGKDSLSMLHILIYLQKKLPQKFDLKVLTVDPGSSGYDPSSLIDYLACLRDGYGQEIEYHFIKENIMSRAYNNNFCGDEKKRVTSICAYCARMKRGVMYATMRKCGANKLVLAQHLDDATESTMMSLFHNGFLRTMKANYTINMGDLCVIRPFIYTREAALTKFALENKLPIINENCPACFEEPKERARMKKLLAREEGLFSNLYDNMKKAILPLMHADSSSLMWSYTNQITNKSKKENKKGKLGKASKQKDSETGLQDSDTNGLHSFTNFESPPSTELSKLSDDDLIAELARRRAKQFTLKGSLQKHMSPSQNGENRNEIDSEESPMCSLNGGPGTVPCYELME